jgi:hypothetical protein
VLLAALDERRPTRDVDLAAIEIDNAIDNITDVMVEIASMDIADGLDIDTDAACADAIREDIAGYTGIRVRCPARLAPFRQQADDHHHAPVDARTDEHGGRPGVSRHDSSRYRRDRRASKTCSSGCQSSFRPLHPAADVVQRADPGAPDPSKVRRASFMSRTRWSSSVGLSSSSGTR